MVLNSELTFYLNNIIKKHGIYCFHINDGPRTKIFSNTKDVEHLESVLNSNFVLIVIGENCFVSPKLNAIRWGYFESIIERNMKEFIDINGALVIDITRIFKDSNVLDTIRYSSFCWNFLRLLFEDNAYNLYVEKRDIENLKPLLDLLIPPKNFWEKRYLDALNIP